MNKFLMGTVAAVILAIAAVLAVILLKTQAQQQFPSRLNATAIKYPNGVYLYKAVIAGPRGGVTTNLVFIQYNNNIMIIIIQNNTKAYALFSSNKFSELYQTSNTTVHMVAYPSLLGYCANFSITQIISGVPVTVSNRACTAQPFSAPANFLELAAALSQSPPPSQLSFAGAVNTPFGKAAVYKNITSINYMFYTFNFTYIIYVLNNGVIYKFSIGVQTAQGPLANVTYTLISSSQVNETYASILSSLARDLPITDMGGSALVVAAQRLGMAVNAGSPTVLAFISLNDTDSAMLFSYNYTLFKGVGLVILDAPTQPRVYGQRLRCLYESLANKSEFLDALRTIYLNVLANSSNPFGVLPNSTCPVDFESEAALLNLALEGANIPPQYVTPPVIIIVYPNGTYAVVYGYNPQALSSALSR
ncbi:MAG: protein-disulfide isomerase [Thermoproteus sp.]|nr:protein-disulfide isomerase [Thermoproteus sp.]